MNDRSDEYIFEQHRRGDPAAFRILIDRYKDDILRFLIRLMGDQASAEDVFQESFLQVHVAAHTFDKDRKFRPWLFTIAANKARDHLRRKGRRKTLDLSAPVDAGGDGGSDGVTFVDLLEVDIPGPSDGLDREAVNLRVQETLDTLPHALREILLLAYFQRLSYVQIADDLGIPLGTVKSRLHSAVATFAKRWKASEQEESSSTSTSEPA